MEIRNDAEAREKVWDMIKDIKVALMTTQGVNGKLHARPMVARKEEGENNDLWFFTRNDSRKIQEIMAHPRVMLNYADPDEQNYVAISGMADVIDDRAKIKELWSEPMRTWFPKGPDDDTLTLIRVQAEEAEYWDSPSSTLVYAYGYVKARLTGEMPNPGESAHVNFPPSLVSSAKH